MDTYAAGRFETKIETFDPCMIDVGGQRGETACSSDRQGTEERQEEGASEIVDDNHRETRTSHEETQQQQQQQQQTTVGPIATIQPNAMANTTLTPVRLPALLDGEFFSVVRVEDTNVTVRCLQCDKLLNGNLKSTGNFLSHIKRVHPFMLERIKCKSNQRKPAIAYVDMTPEKSMEFLKTKRVYRKYYKPDENQIPANEEVTEQVQNWPDSPMLRRRKYDEVHTFLEPPEIQKLPQAQHDNNSYVVEDEFDAIGKNVAAKLRNMRLDQRIVAEKLLNDVLFEAQLGTLHRDSSIHV